MNFQEMNGNVLKVFLFRSVSAAALLFTILTLFCSCQWKCVSVCLFVCRSDREKVSKDRHRSC